LSAHDAEASALDQRNAIDQRLDAVTIVVSQKNGNPMVLQRLIACDDPIIFVETLKRVKDFRTKWAKSVLLDSIERSDDNEKRALLTWALAAYPEDRGVEKFLVGAAIRDDDPDVRAHAIESLAQFRSERVFRLFVQILECGSPAERFWALYGLGTQADSRSRELVNRFTKDATEIPGFGTIAEEARWALSKIGPKR
jgi:HEAT repeat protein